MDGFRRGLNPSGLIETVFENCGAANPGRSRLSGGSGCLRLLEGDPIWVENFLLQETLRCCAALPKSTSRLGYVDQPLFVTFRLYGSLPAHRVFPPDAQSGKAFVAMDRLLDRAISGPLYLRRPEIAETGAGIFARRGSPISVTC